MTKKARGQDLVKKDGDKVYVDKLLSELINSKKAVLKELAYR